MGAYIGQRNRYVRVNEKALNPVFLRVEELAVEHRIQLAIKRKIE